VLLVVAGGDHPRHGARYAETLKRRWGGVARFTGWVPEGEIAAWHSAADLALFAYPAPHSSSGAIAMALAHGTPFLTSDSLGHCMGLPTEMSVSLKGRELAERLRRLAADRDSLAELGQVSTSIRAGRSWPEVADSHLRLYERVASGAIAPEDRSQLEAV
jgi:glycosyltransferase involved in cell wall biosynthesis